MTKLLFIGCGKMGSAILRGLLNKKLSWEIQVIDHHPENVAPFLSQVSFADNLGEVDSPDVILLGVKPQAMDRLLEDLSAKSFTDALVISIAAGKNLSYFKEALPDQDAIIRSMPNLPASLGVGVTAAIADRDLSEKHQQIATQILSAAGTLIWLDDESQMDAVTAVSGSGPAYLFHLCEVMTQAGVALGLPLAMSEQLARETIMGSAELLKVSDKSAEMLRAEVTSPGGTTEAALSVLMENDAMKKLFEKALNAAALQSKELS